MAAAIGDGPKEVCAVSPASFFDYRSSFSHGDDDARSAGAAAVRSARRLATNSAARRHRTRSPRERQKVPPEPAAGVWKNGHVPQGRPGPWQRYRLVAMMPVSHNITASTRLLPHAPRRQAHGWQ